MITRIQNIDDLRDFIEECVEAWGFHGNEIETYLSDFQIDYPQCEMAMRLCEREYPTVYPFVTKDLTLGLTVIAIKDDIEGDASMLGRDALFDLDITEDDLEDIFTMEDLIDRIDALSKELDDFKEDYTPKEDL